MTIRMLLTIILAGSVAVKVAAAQMPRDRPAPAPAKSAITPVEVEMRARVAASPTDAQAALALAKLQEDGGRYAEAEATLLGAKAALPTSIPLLNGIAAFYNRQGDFDKTIQHLEDAARLDPTNPQGFHLVGAYYQEKAARDPRLTEEKKRAYIESGLGAEDAALALRPDYVEALVYKNILLRSLALIEPSPGVRERLIADADVLRNRAMQLQKEQAAPAIARPRVPLPPAPPQTYAAANAPVRVGGNIRVPSKTKHANPKYPDDALAARIEGVVICEIIIDPSGRVSDVKVLRSIPLLDAAAVEAVRQWEFEPTYLNGMAVPVIMTVTVNFRLE